MYSSPYVFPPWNLYWLEIVSPPKTSLAYKPLQAQVSVVPPWPFLGINTSRNHTKDLSLFLVPCPCPPCKPSALRRSCALQLPPGLHGQFSGDGPSLVTVSGAGWAEELWHCIIKCVCKLQKCLVKYFLLVSLPWLEPFAFYFYLNILAAQRGNKMSVKWILLNS